MSSSRQGLLLMILYHFTDSREDTSISRKVLYEIIFSIQNID
jgi:hypothetical protein